MPFDMCVCYIENILIRAIRSEMEVPMGKRKLKFKNFDLGLLEKLSEMTEKENAESEENMKLLAELVNLRSTAECDFSKFTPQKLYELACFELDNEAVINGRVRQVNALITACNDSAHVKNRRYAACL